SYCYDWIHLPVRSLQYVRKFTDQVCDFLRLMTMTNQNCVTGSDNNQVMNSKQRDCCPVLIENDVISGIDRRDRAVRSISLFVVFEIIRYCSPASDVVPIESRFYHQNTVCFFHDRVIE